MKQQTASPSPTTSPESFGLFTTGSGAGAERVALPLKAVDARFEIDGDCASVSIEQLFEFDGPNPVDVIYVFPLPDNAAVHRCEMHIGGRTVRAVARPQEQAREEFERAHAAGHRAALMERLRGNLFELRLGNVQPGDEIQLRLGYIQTLEGADGARTLRIPVCPGVRYIPGFPVGADGGTDLVPDAGRLNPPRIGAHDPQAALFFCAGTLSGGSEVQCETHGVDIGQGSEDEPFSIMLRHEAEVPDREFVLTWRRDEQPLALASVDAPDYMLCSAWGPTDMPTERAPRDLFFLLDSSGSMIGENWAAVAGAMKVLLPDLGEHDRISVDLFAFGRTTVTNGLIPSRSPEAQRLPDRLAAMQPSGGTEFTRAFLDVISMAGKARCPVIVVLTDGQFGDETRACKLAADSGIEVHTIGIDANVNDAVLRAIARRTRGTCTLCAPSKKEVTTSMQGLVRRILSPALDRIRLGDGWRLAGNPPALRGGEYGLVPFIRETAQENPGQPPSEVKATLRFTDGSERALSLPTRPVKGPAPALLAAKAEITSLLDQGSDQEAVALACRHNLLCEGVSFLAIDDAEKVVVANAILEQPSLEPHSFMAASMAFPSAPMMSCELAEDSPVFPSLPARIRHRRAPLKSVSALPPESRETPPMPCDEAPSSAPDGSTWLGISGWGELRDLHLTPWAQKRKAHMKILLRLLRDLLALSGDKDPLPKALELLRAFAPHLAATDPAAHRTLLELIDAHETG